MHKVPVSIVGVLKQFHQRADWEATATVLQHLVAKQVPISPEANFIAALTLQKFGKEAWVQQVYTSSSAKRADSWRNAHHAQVAPLVHAFCALSAPFIPGNSHWVQALETMACVSEHRLGPMIVDALPLVAQELDDPFQVGQVLGDGGSALTSNDDPSLLPMRLRQKLSATPVAQLLQALVIQHNAFHREEDVAWRLHCCEYSLAIRDGEFMQSLFPQLWKPIVTKGSANAKFHLAQAIHAHISAYERPGSELILRMLRQAQRTAIVSVVQASASWREALDRCSQVQSANSGVDEHYSPSSVGSVVRSVADRALIVALLQRCAAGDATNAQHVAWEGALHIFENVGRGTPRDGPVHLALMGTLRRGRRWVEAIALCERLIVTPLTAGATSVLEKAKALLSTSSSTAEQAEEAAVVPSLLVQSMAGEDSIDPEATIALEAIRACAGAMPSSWWYALALLGELWRLGVDPPSNVYTAAMTCVPSPAVAVDIACRAAADCVPRRQQNFFHGVRNALGQSTTSQPWEVALRVALVAEQIPPQLSTLPPSSAMLLVLSSALNPVTDVDLATQIVRRMVSYDEEQRARGEKESKINERVGGSLSRFAVRDTASIPKPIAELLSYTGTAPGIETSLIRSVVGNGYWRLALAIYRKRFNGLLDMDAVDEGALAQLHSQSALLVLKGTFQNCGLAETLRIVAKAFSATEVDGVLGCTTTLFPISTVGNKMLGKALEELFEEDIRTQLLDVISPLRRIADRLVVSGLIQYPHLVSLLNAVQSTSERVDEGRRLVLGWQTMLPPSSAASLHVALASAMLLLVGDHVDASAAEQLNSARILLESVLIEKPMMSVLNSGSAAGVESYCSAIALVLQQQQLVEKSLAGRQSASRWQTAVHLLQCQSTIAGFMHDGLTSAALKLLLELSPEHSEHGVATITKAISDRYRTLNPIAAPEVLEMLDEILSTSKDSESRKVGRPSSPSENAIDGTEFSF